MSKIEPKETFVIEYNIKDLCLILGYSKFLREHIELGDKIPARVLLKYASLFNLEEDRIEAEIKSVTSRNKACVIDRYGKLNEYSFKNKMVLSSQPPFFYEPFNIPGQSLIDAVSKKDYKPSPKYKRKPKYIKSDCSFAGMVKYVFDDIEKFLFKKIEKRDFIKSVNTSINKYFKQFQGDTLKLFGQYKRTVIVGYIAYKFDYSLSKEIMDIYDGEPTNTQLFQAVKHYTKGKVNTIK